MSKKKKWSKKQIEKVFWEQRVVDLRINGKYLAKVITDYQLQQARSTGNVLTRNEIRAKSGIPLLNENDVPIVVPKSRKPWWKRIFRRG